MYLLIMGLLLGFSFLIMAMLCMSKILAHVPGHNGLAASSLGGGLASIMLPFMTGLERQQRVDAIFVITLFVLGIMLLLFGVYMAVDDRRRHQSQERAIQAALRD